MAITAANKDATGSTGTSPFTTGSVAFANNKLYLVAIGIRAVSGVATVSSITGGGLTWVNITSVTNTSTHNEELWRGLVTSGASTGALTITTSGTVARILWSIDELTGTDTSGTNGSGAIVQNGTQAVGTATSGSVALAAFGSSSNAAYGMFMHHANETSVKDADVGWAALANFAFSTNTGMITEWNTGRDADGTVNASWTTSAVFAGIAVEVKVGGATTNQAVAVTVTFTPALVRQTNKIIAIVATFAVAAARQVNKAIATAVTFAASFIRQTNKSIAVTVTHTVSIAAAKIKTLTIAVGVTFSAAFSRITNKTIPVTVTFSTGFQRMTTKTIAVGVTFAAAATRMTNKAIATTATFAAAISRTTNKVITVTVTFSVAFARVVQKTIGIVVTYATAISRITAKAIGVGVAFAVGMTKQVAKTIAAGMTFILDTATAVITRNAWFAVGHGSMFGLRNKRRVRGDNETQGGVIG